MLMFQNCWKSALDLSDTSVSKKEYPASIYLCVIGLICDSVLSSVHSRCTNDAIRSLICRNMIRDDSKEESFWYSMLLFWWECWYFEIIQALYIRLVIPCKSVCCGRLLRPATYVLPAGRYFQRGPEKVTSCRIFIITPFVFHRQFEYIEKSLSNGQSMSIH